MVFGKLGNIGESGCEGREIYEQEIYEHVTLGNGYK